MTRGATLAGLSAYRTIGRYRVYSELASGGMATVHLGCLLGPAGFSKLVAIKCLHEQFAVEQEFVAMFLDEARLTSSIHHPNVVASLDVVAEGGELLVVMEYVHGETLAALLRSSRQSFNSAPVPVVTRVMCDALEGLHAAHIASLAGRCLNIVHRDVSPQNIMVGADGNTRVLDFGIAQAAMRSRVSGTGRLKGKIAYMSPEQVQGHAVDARTDIFAAGVVLWEALTGRRLFFAAEPSDSVNLVLTSPIPPPSAIVPALPVELDRVVLKALERDPEQRFKTAHDFAEALRKASSEGSRREVSNWVGHVAKDSLARRLALLETLEASAVHAQVDASVPVLVGGSSLHPASVPAPASASTPPPLADATHTAPISVSAVLPVPQPAPRRPRAPWWTAGGGIVLAVTAWAFATKHTPAPTAAKAIIAPTVAEAIIAPTAAKAIIAPTAAEAIIAPTAAKAIIAPTVAIATARAPVEPTPLAQPESLPLAPNAPSMPKATASKPLPAAKRARPKSCTPPYRIDDFGVRRVKLECL